MVRPSSCIVKGGIPSSRRYLPTSPPGPSGGPFMTHILPGRGVLRVHGARSPVPPRLPHFATPRSVRHLATVVAGAYLLRRRLDAWLPGPPTPPGPCYWLVTRGTPMGWRGGCPARGLVRSPVCYYCLGGCSALVVCARRSRHVWGVGAGAGSCFSPWAPPCPRFPPSVCCGLSCRGVPSLPCWYAIPCSLCVPRAPTGCPSGPRRVSVAFVCARAPAAYAPPPPSGSVWRAHHAPFRCSAPVGPFQVVRAPPRFLPRSCARPI